MIQPMAPSPFGRGLIGVRPIQDRLLERTASRIWRIQGNSLVMMQGALPNFNNCLTAHQPNVRTTGYFRSGPPGKHPVPGPLMIGSGRHCGLGVFAAFR